MQTFHHMSIVGAFDLLRTGIDLNAPGYTIKHDQPYYDGKCTLVHLLCVDDSTGKAVWHAWRIVGSPWNEELIRRAVMDRMFSVNELVCFGDILYYDPMHMVQLPHRHKADALLTSRSHTQPNGMIRNQVYGRQIGPQNGAPLYMNNRPPQNMGPSDYPFMPGPGLPMSPQLGMFPWVNPQQPQVSTAVQATTGLPNATRAAVDLLNPHEQAFYRITLQQLITHLNNPAIWNWNEDTDTDPKTEFSYKDGNFPRGVQRLMRKHFLLAAQRFGFKVSWSTPDLETTALTISIDLSLEDN
jgi:hypothetical protein